MWFHELISAQIFVALWLNVSKAAKPLTFFLLYPGTHCPLTLIVKHREQNTLVTKGRAWRETYEVKPWHAFHVHNPVYRLANHSRNSERYLFEILPQLIRLIRILLKKLSFFWLFVPNTSLQFIMTSTLMGVIIFFLPLLANRLFISFLYYFFFFFSFFFSPSLSEAFSGWQDTWWVMRKHGFFFGAPKRAKQLSMATIALCFEFFRCRVDVLQS